jgi:multicomponent Na+:H+ antiporter subunit C
MNLIIAIIIGILFTASIFLMLHRSFFKLILGVIIFGYATIFFLFVVCGVTRNAPPLVTDTSNIDLANIADPLPQALTLTAIVIGIGIQIFVIVLLKKVFQIVETEDLDALIVTDKVE